MIKAKVSEALASILLLAAAPAQPASGAAPRPAPPPQTPEAHYRVFDSEGRPAGLREIVEALDGRDVLIIGESHDDAVAHALEAELLRRAFERYGQARAGERPPRAVALALEMFERDVQTVVDEYLAGLITETHFLAGSRPWKNYQSDYRPLVEYAKGKRLPVVAANAPARYVNRVSRLGPESLRELSAQAKAWLPALPLRPASEAYAEKFRQFMRGDAAPAHTPPATAPGTAPPGSRPPPARPAAQATPHASASHLLDAQTLRDATMAFTLGEFLRLKPGALVLHVNGRFHSEGGLGVPEHLRRYSRGARQLVVTILPGEGFPAFDAARAGGLGDFVILTDPALSR